MRLLIALCTAILLQGCGTIHNTMRDGSDERVILRGNDAVSYFTSPQPLKGDPAIKSVYAGDVYRFANAEHKRLFDADPVISFSASAGPVRAAPTR